MKNFNKLSLLVLVLSIILVTCNKDEMNPRVYPRINSLPVNNITSSGATFNADIYEHGNAEIIDHGFVWGVGYTNLSVEYNDHVSLGPFKGTGPFQADIKTSLKAQVTYFVRSYVKSADYTVYGKVVQFMSLGSEAPVITDFSPKTASWGDTILIKGKNFSWVKYNNSIYFNSKIGLVIKSTDTLLSVIVPIATDSFKNILSVELAGNVYRYTKDTFQLKLPEITDFSPKTATWGDTIIIMGNDLNKYPNTTFFINNINVTAIKSPNNQYKIVVPANLTLVSSKIKITVNQVSSLAPDEFKLKPPLIKSFSPTSCFNSTSITIKGKYFKNNNTTVKINGYELYYPTVIGDSIINCSLSSIGSDGDYKFSITVFGQQTLSDSSFHYAVAKISKIEPAIATFGDTISIYGNFFNEIPGNNIVHIGDTGPSANIIYASKNLLKITVPASTYNLNIPVIVETSHLYVTGPNFQFKRPVVSTLSPTTIKIGDTIKITGDYFNPVKNYNILYSNGDLFFKCENITASRNYLTFKVTNGFSNIATLTLFTASYVSFQINQPIKFLSPYRKTVNNYLDGYYINGFFSFSAVVNGKGYIGGYNGTPIYEYDSGSDQWTFKNDLGNNTKLGPAYFTLNNKIYIIGGYAGLTGLPIYYNDVIEYDPALNQISTKRPFPGAKRVGAFGFSIGNKGYAGSGEIGSGIFSKDFWEYDASIDTWTQKSDFAGGACAGTCNFVINGKAYILNQQSLWEYDPVNDTWVQKKNFPGNSRYHAVSFVINNLGYIAAGSPYYGYYLSSPAYFYNDLWLYDPVADTWTQKTSYPGYSFSGGIHFVIDNKAYIGLGYIDSGYESSIYNNQAFQYDPSLEP